MDKPVLCIIADHSPPPTPGQVAVQAEKEEGNAIGDAKHKITSV